MLSEEAAWASRTKSRILAELRSKGVSEAEAHQRWDYGGISGYEGALYDLAEAYRGSELLRGIIRGYDFASHVAGHAERDENGVLILARLPSPDEMVEWHLCGYPREHIGVVREAIDTILSDPQAPICDQVPLASVWYRSSNRWHCPKLALRESLERVLYAAPEAITEWMLLALLRGESTDLPSLFRRHAIPLALTLVPQRPPFELPSGFQAAPSLSEGVFDMCEFCALSALGSPEAFCLALDQGLGTVLLRYIGPLALDLVLSGAVDYSPDALPSLDSIEQTWSRLASTFPVRYRDSFLRVTLGEDTNLNEHFRLSSLVDALGERKTREIVQLLPARK